MRERKWVPNHETGYQFIRYPGSYFRKNPKVQTHEEKGQMLFLKN